MTELLMELVDKWIFIIAVIAVGVTETLMRATGEKVTRWLYAIPSTIVTAIILSIAIAHKQELVSLQDGLWRGVIASILAIFAYDVLKAVSLQLPFIKKGK